MESNKTLLLFIVLLLPFPAHGTVFNYTVTGSGLIREAPGTPYQGTGVTGSFFISDIVGQDGYGGGPSYTIPYFELLFDGGQYFTGSGMFLFGDETSWISTWTLNGTGNWSRWYGDGGGYSPLFYNDDGTPYNQGAEYRSLASYIELGNLFTTFDINGNEQFPGTFILDTLNNPTQRLALSRTGAAPVPEPGTIALLGFGLVLAIGIKQLKTRGMHNT